MINIRYHIVSITAVFLALGLGVALGSTFLDGPTMDVLNRNITSAEVRIKEANEKIDQLEDIRDSSQRRDGELILVGPQRLLAQELADQKVVVIAEPGVGADQTSALRSVLEQSGADLRATLTLTDKLLSGGDVSDELLEELGLTESSSNSAIATNARSSLSRVLAAAGEFPPEPDPEQDPETPTETTTTTAGGNAGTTTTTAGATTTTTPEDSNDPESESPLDGTEPAIVALLESDGLIEIAPGPSHDDDDPILETIGYRYIFAGSSNPAAGATALPLSLLKTQDSIPLPAVVVVPTHVAVRGEDENLRDLVQMVRSDEELSNIYSTVDNIDTFAGLAASALATADLQQGPVGHFGQANGASSLLPPAS